MRHKDAFSACHPVVNFLYFALVLVYTMFFLHPVSLSISLACAVGCAVYLNGRKAVRFGLTYVLPIMALTVLINPAFNHRGETVLATLPTGSPLTLEAVWYGLATAAMLGAVVMWFSCYSAVVTGDKFIYLFGRILPALSLVLSMTLRFVPKFTAQFKVVREAQRCVGRDTVNGSLPRRIRNAATILSIMVTWSLENAIETADSMKSRGYGLKGRSAYSIYRFDRRSKLALGWLLLCGAYILAGAAAGALDWQYVPAVEFALGGALPVSVQAAWLALGLTPIIINGREDLKWRSLRSKA